MKHNTLQIIIVSALFFAAPRNALNADEPATIDYNQQIAPLLRTYCAACHNADDREGKLALDSYAGLLKGGERGSVVNAGHSELSRLVRGAQRRRQTGDATRRQ